MSDSISSDKIRNICPPDQLGCKSSDDVEPLQGIIGQDRAVQALQFGLNIDSFGYNIYVAGQPGTGKLTAVKNFLQEEADQKESPQDWCYVNNFNDPYRPRKLTMPPGIAQQFKQDMQTFIQEVGQALQKAFDSDRYGAKREDITKDYEKKQQNIFDKLQNKAQEYGFVLKQTPSGIATIPVKEDGEKMSNQEFSQLDEDKQEEIREKQRKLQSEINQALKKARKLERETNEELHKLERDAALYAIEVLINELKDKYKDEDDVLEYLEEVKEDILNNLDQFQKSSNQQEQFMQALGQREEEDPHRKYNVNVLVDNAEQEGAPVIIELNPTYNNLFGKVEKESRMGTFTTDFTLIKDGALHRANGGYLVIPVEELFKNPLSWDSLKRTIRNGKIDIEDPGEQLGYLTTKSLKPESIPMDIKIILIGPPNLYQLVYQLDSDFRELFKVKADFDTTMERNKGNIDKYLAFVCKVCKEEDLQRLNAKALSKIIEHSSRLAADQTKLSARFGEITDVIREANYYAQQDKQKEISSEHIQKAIQKRFHRSNLLQEKIQDLIKDGTLKIEPRGEKVGLVNGLSVIQFGDITFGRPNRITATISMGSNKVIDIEREAKLSGPIHTKGVLILSGYLSEKFGHEQPITLSARLVFEQSYSEIEGDSASSAELYALLSGLAKSPIKQGIAVTGSVNQKGEVQAVGGVNEKVEGFYETCQLKGLTGEQGVIMPSSNVKNLMLKQEVVDAVENDQFHIWPVSHINEGIEILTGIKAGEPKKDGTYPKESINAKVTERLKEMSLRMKKFKRPESTEE